MVRTGYHIDEGRVLPAERISYDHCRSDRVNCPFCGNRVFKGVRGQGPSAVHYLSHYRAQSEQARTCEARSAFREREEGSDEDAVTRGQSLRTRVSALRRLLDKQFPRRAGTAGHFQATTLVRKRRDLLVNPVSALHFMRATTTVSYQILAAIDGIHVDLKVPTEGVKVEDLRTRTAEARRDPPIGTPRHSRNQTVLAADMRRLLVLHESRRALEALHDHAWASLLDDPWRRPRTAIEQHLLPSMTSATSRQGGWIEPMDEQVGEDPDQHIGAYADALICQRMDDILLEIDYAAKVPLPPLAAEPKRRKRPKKTHRRRR
jgi:hypothetical protein